MINLSLGYVPVCRSMMVGTIADWWPGIMGHAKQKQLPPTRRSCWHQRLVCRLVVTGHGRQWMNQARQPIGQGS
jgi:hypothetical protein